MRKLLMRGPGDPKVFGLDGYVKKKRKTDVTGYTFDSKPILKPVNFPLIYMPQDKVGVAFGTTYYGSLEQGRRYRISVRAYYDENLTVYEDLVLYSKCITFYNGNTLGLELYHTNFYVSLTIQMNQVWTEIGKLVDYYAIKIMDVSTFDVSSTTSTVTLTKNICMVDKNLDWFKTNATEYTLPSNYLYQMQCYNEKLYVADTHRFYRSDNYGATWTTYTNSVSDSIWPTYFKYYNGIFYGVSETRNGAGTTCGIKFSTTGESWTASNITNLTASQLYFNDGKYIVLGETLNSNGGTDTKYTYSSSDGKNWTFMGNNNFLYVYCAHNTYLGVDRGSGVYYSTDLKTWTLTPITLDIGDVSVIYTKHKWFVASHQTNKVYYSSTGSSWTLALDTVSEEILDLAYINNQLVLYTYEDDVVYVSDDGMAWTKVTNTGWYNYDTVNYARGNNMGTHHGINFHLYDTGSSSSSGYPQRIYVSVDTHVWKSGFNSIYTQHNNLDWDWHLRGLFWLHNHLILRLDNKVIKIDLPPEIAANSLLDYRNIT